MDWSQITSNPAILGAAAAGVVVVLVLVGVLRRRRKSAPTTQILTPQDIISQMGAFCPPFSAMMETFSSKQSLSSFLQQTEAASAFEKLEEYLEKQQRAAAGKDTKGVLYFNNAPTLDNDVKASLITIARCVYADDSYQQQLEERDREHFDQLLDSLT